MPRPISAAISLSAMRHNLGVVAAALEQTGRARPNIWAVIKANAYGHGIENAVQAFSGADGLAMLDLDEAVRCRDAGWTRPILLLEGFFEARDIDVLRRHRLSAVLHCEQQIDMLLASGPGHPVDALVKLNTGMNRLGFSESDYAAAYTRALEAQRLGVLGALGKMTHFACADDDSTVTREQIAIFSRVTRGLPGRVSVCNSAASLTPGLWASLPDSSEHWVRPGICLYGSSPFSDKSGASFDLRPAMTLSAELISEHVIEKGAGVGYGHTFVAPEPMRIGVVACGYADGYPRHAATGTPITVHGAPSRVLGRVSMDMLMVDITHIPQAGIGSRAVLWGDGGPSVDEVASASGTLGYELLCAVAPRVPKKRA